MKPGRKRFEWLKFCRHDVKSNINTNKGKGISNYREPNIIMAVLSHARPHLTRITTVMFVK